MPHGGARAQAVARGVGAAAAGTVAWALLVEPRRLVVRRHDLRPAGWPAALDGLRVALISDVHAGGLHVDGARVGRIVARVQRERPDLVLVLGDLVDDAAPLTDHEQAEPGPIADRIGRLRAPLGVVAVLGNHDWHTGGHRVARALRAAGVTVLENRAVRVGDGARELWLAGLADATERDPDVAGTLEGVPDGAPVVVLSHDPDVFPLIPARVALTVSGHTHGGQLAVPGLKRLWTPSQHGERYAGGHVVEDGRHLVVSRGIGTSSWPVRLGAPPELVVLRLFSG
jgi:predicted MPP superfamily phosphohydrolase